MMKLQFTTGIEIETGVQGSLSNSFLPKTWCAGTDVSSGLEYRSGIITDSVQLVNEVQQTCQVLDRAGRNIHPKCGLHVHIGFKQIGDLSAKYRLFRFVSVYEHLFFQLVPPWIERAGYCRKLPTSFWTSVQKGEGFQFWLGAADEGAALNPRAAARRTADTRYWWFNGAAMQRHGTVEFRQMNGTLNADDILGWVAVLQCMFSATTFQQVKLDWGDHQRATVSNLLTDLRVDHNEIFGQRAKKFIIAQANKACS
jgi:hypothetical protein